MTKAPKTKDRADIDALAVRLGGEVEVLQPPSGKDIDQQMIVDLRRMLSHAGDVFLRTRSL